MARPQPATTSHSAHLDPFARDHLPPADTWPEIDLSHPNYAYPERLNAVVELLDRWIETGHGAARCLIGAGATWSYRDLHERVNRIANVLTRELGLVPGNRVLLRSANTPMMAACYLAVLKAGGIAVGTMPLLRAGELKAILRKAEISHALCDAALKEELEAARASCPGLTVLRTWNAEGTESLDALMARQPADFDAVDTAAEDISLIAFTSGTTGEPKGCLHNHRDLLAICDGFSREVLRPEASDLFCGSPPLAFTFGLGGLLLFPLRVGAASLLLEKASPPELVKAIEAHKATVCVTAPTAYRAMLAVLEGHDVSSLRKGVSAGEALPKATSDAFFDATGLRLIDGIGATELLHIFISAREEEIRPGATGKVVPGYSARVLDEDGRPLPPGRVGRLAVKGPTGCRYLADARQRKYVRDGWNLTGDAYLVDEDGYFWFQARADDMIVSSGYNIAGPEVENAVLTHPAVAECAVVGTTDPERGALVKAFVVLKPEVKAGPALAKAIQDHVKASIAPYKYPREIEWRDALPKTQTGKLQRFRLREAGAS